MTRRCRNGVLPHRARSDFGQAAKRRLALATLFAGADRGFASDELVLHCAPGHLGQEASFTDGLIAALDVMVSC